MIKPLNDYVLLRKSEPEKKVGQIIITTKQEDKTNVGTVVAMGPGKMLDNGTLLAINGISIEDKVIYREYAGTEYEENDTKYLLIKAEDILAVIEK